MKAGWEYKKLGDIGTFIRGGNFSKRDFVEDGFPCIHYGQIHMKFGVETLRNISSVPAEMVKNDRCAKKGDLVIAITSEDDAGSCKCTAWMGDYDVYVGGHTAIYRHTMQPKYVSYYFMSPYFQKDKLEYTHGFKVVEISPKDIAKISIPVPPLSEQQSIVDYLDSAFAKIDAMKANAEKALNEAKALFQASLKEMLEPKEDWKYKKLGEVCEILDSRRKPITKNKREPGTIPYYGATGILDYVKDYIFDEKLVLLGEDGAKWGAGENSAYIIEGKTWVNNHAHALRPKRELLVDELLVYYLNFANLQPFITGVTVPKLNQEKMRSIEIPVPPISEQQYIVATLDSLKSKVDRLQANYDKISQECDALKQAILRQVFE